MSSFHPQPRAFSSSSAGLPLGSSNTPSRYVLIFLSNVLFWLWACAWRGTCCNKQSVRQTLSSVIYRRRSGSNRTLSSTGWEVAGWGSALLSCRTSLSCFSLETFDEAFSSLGPVSHQPGVTATAHLDRAMSHWGEIIRHSQWGLLVTRASLTGSVRGDSCGEMSGSEFRGHCIVVPSRRRKQTSGPFESKQEHLG